MSDGPAEIQKALHELALRSNREDALTCRKAAGMIGSQMLDLIKVRSVTERWTIKDKGR